VNQFASPRKYLKNIDADSAARLIGCAADVALVLDRDGVIRDVSVSSDELDAEGYGRWVGRPWVDTVTIESRSKVEALLKDAVPEAALPWRHINHPSPAGGDFPILYSTVKVGKTGPVVAVGRSLRAASILQQRLVEAQQSLERDYARMRQAETRYRLLFQTSAEAVLVLDGASTIVLEANPAALRMLGNGAHSVVGRPFAEAFDDRSATPVSTLVNAVRATGQGDEVRVRAARGKRAFRLSASLFRADTGTHLLARLGALDGSVGAAVDSPLTRAIEHLPDGFVVTELDGRVLMGNRAFLDLVQVGAEDQLRGKALDEWLGRSRVDLNVLIANLKQHGAVRLFATTLRGALGAETEVEISAVSVPDGETPCLAFSVRSVGRRLAPLAARVGRELPRSVDQLTELIGRVPLKDIVRETADVIERLCIEAALKLTGDNRASAAEMLGLSRQSLYVKLHRYGMGEREQDPAA
jgi:transcriptional regulator PpsR